MTRSEWKAKHPHLQERYLAFCAANNAPPGSWESNVEFISFINRAAIAFMKTRGLPVERLGIFQTAFTDWLWEHGRDYIEAQI